MSHRTQWFLTLALVFGRGSALAEEKFSPVFAGRSSAANGQVAAAEPYSPYPVAAADAQASVDQNLAYAMALVNNIAGIYLAQGKYYQAELLYQTWLARLEKALATGAGVRAAAKQYWLLALKDGSIRVATDYWVEGNTLHYVSRAGIKESAPLSDVDVALAKQLNQERGMEFRLPSPSAAK